MGRIPFAAEGRHPKHLMAMAIALVLSACAGAPKPVAGPAPLPAPAESRPAEVASAGFKPDVVLRVCPLMSVSNAPAADLGVILGFNSLVQAAPGVLLAVSPVNGACLSSGFGPRNGNAHKGIDLQSKPAGMVHAAGTGVVREAGARADYGNQVVIDHGGGIFTRYAHLVGLEPGLKEGARVPFGTPLGVMGASSVFKIPVHLHFEVLRGDYETPKKSFGLTPVDIFSLPRWDGK